MSALFVLIMSNNGSACKKAGEALGEALKANTVLKELDVSANLAKSMYGNILRSEGPGFTQGLLKGLSLLSLNISCNSIGSGWGGSTDGTLALKHALEGNITLTELNISSNGFQAADIQLLATAIRENETLFKFDVSDNGIRAEGGKALAEALKGNKVMTELNIRDTSLAYNVDAVSSMSGMGVVSNIILHMEALSKLSTSGNFFYSGFREAQIIRVQQSKFTEIKLLCISKGIVFD
jgi:Ran GTPase-activating protein (RanGAP) involved in mRNA processing and transport